MQTGKRCRTSFIIRVSAISALIFALVLPWEYAIAAKSYEDSPSEKHTADRSLFLQLVVIFENIPETVPTEMPPKDTTDLIPTPPTEAPPHQVPGVKSKTAPEPGPPVTTWVLIIAFFVIIAVIVHIVISRRLQD